MLVYSPTSNNSGTSSRWSPSARAVFRYDIRARSARSRLRLPVASSCMRGRTFAIIWRGEGRAGRARGARFWRDVLRGSGEFLALGSSLQPGVRPLEPAAIRDRNDNSRVHGKPASAHQPPEERWASLVWILRPRPLGTHWGRKISGCNGIERNAKERKSYIIPGISDCKSVRLRPVKSGSNRLRI